MMNIAEFLQQQKEQGKILPRKQIDNAYEKYSRRYDALSLVKNLKPKISYSAFSIEYTTLINASMPDPIQTILNDQEVISDAQRAGIERMVNDTHDTFFWSKIESQINFWTPKNPYGIAASLTRDDLREAARITRNYFQAKAEFDKLLSTEKGFAAFNIIMNMGYDGRLSDIYSPGDADTLITII